MRLTASNVHDSDPPPSAVWRREAAVGGGSGVLALQSQLNSLSRQFAAVMDTVLHGENGPAAQV